MSQQIDHVLEETRLFEPPAEFAAAASVKSRSEYDAMYQQSIEDPDTFWSNVAGELHWFKQWDRVCNAENMPFVKWFEGGTTNISYNCLDRHLSGARKNKAAIIWEGEPGDQVILTYQELHRRVCRAANGLKKLGVKKGDRVAIYMPMVPELAIAMLACARIGAIHSIIFGGFSATAISDRVHDADCSCVITADGGWRRGGIVALKDAVDEALANCPTVKSVLVVKRTENDVKMESGRDHWWHDVMAEVSDVCPAEEMDAEDPLYILYTSGVDREAEGHFAHDGRLHGGYVPDVQVCV